MFERVLLMLQIFTARLDQCNKETLSILKCVHSGDFEKLEEITNNREKLLDIITQEQERIEKTINTIISEELTATNINIIKSWAFDTQNWINRTSKLDQSIIEALNNSKDAVTKEIATVFKSKAAFRGYNLNDVTK